MGLPFPVALLISSLIGGFMGFTSVNLFGPAGLLAALPLAVVVGGYIGATSE